MYLLENVSIADFWLLYVLVRFSWPKITFCLRDIQVVLVFMVMFPLLGSLASKFSHFEWNYWLTNSLRSIFYGFVFLALNQMVQKRSSWLIRTLNVNITIVLISVIIELFLTVIGQPYSFYIPGLSQNIISEINLSDIRPSSFFDEPSYLAIFVASHYYFLKQLAPSKHTFPLICLILLLASGSMSGLLFAAILLIFDNNFTYNKSSKVFIGIVCLSLVGVMVWMNFPRFISILIGEDGSFAHRIFGTIELINILITEYWVSGIGLGQFNVWLTSGGSIGLVDHYFNYTLKESSGINNGFLMLLGSLGMPGLVGFIWFVFRCNPSYLFILLTFAFLFSWGYILHPLMIFYFGVAYAIKDIRAENFDVNRKYISNYSRR